MTTPPRGESERPSRDPGPPIWEDTGLLLFGLLLLALGVWGLATGQTILVFPGDHRTGTSLSWLVAEPGARVVAAGELALAAGLIGRWRWGEWYRWSTRLGLAGGALLVIGLLVVGVVRLVNWLA